MSILYKKQLNKRHIKKRLKALDKTFFKDQKQGLILFEEYLKYLRDSILIFFAGTRENELIKAKITPINVALSKLRSWQKAENESKKDFHWNNFCEVLKLNMKEWLAPNDSV